MTASGTALSDPTNPFFQSLGQNGRSCSSCHVPEAGMTITPEFVQARFEQTEGMDPLFRTVDGSSSPVADVSNLEGRRRAYALLLDRALIRVGIGVPANAEFELVGVEDPYGFATAQELSLFRSASVRRARRGTDDLGIASIPGTCTTCHDTPNAGNHSVPAPLRIGVDAVEPVGGLNVAALPVYTLRKLTTGEIERTTDPGRAVITGRWKDIGRFKGPTLRGLAARAPYFHNGSAARLEDVINFYDTRFGMGLTEQEKSDLLAFLSAL